MTVSTQTYQPTMTVGQVYLRIAGSADPLRAIGNVSQLDLEIEEDVKDLTDYTAIGGGIWDTVARVKNVSLAVTLHDLDGENLKLASHGAVTAVAAAAVPAEALTAVQGGLCRLAHPGPTLVTVTCATPAWVTATAYALGAQVRKTTSPSHVYQCTVAGTSGASEPTWKTDGTTTADGSTLVWADLGAFAAVDGTDFDVRPEGIMIRGGGIPSGCAISAAYSHGAYIAVEGLVTAQQTYEMAFGGLNEANAGSPCLLDVWRCKFGAAKKRGFIGDDFQAVELSGRVLKDTSKGVGKSAYFREQVV